MQPTKSLYAIFAIVILLAGLTSSPAQDKQLTFQQTYKGGQPRLFSPLPQIKGWYDDKNFLQIKRTSDAYALLKVNAQNGDESVLLDYNEINKKLPEGFAIERADEYSNDYRHFMFNQKNDIYYYSIKNNSLKQLTNSPDVEEYNPSFSPDYKKIAFTRNYNLYVIDINSGKETQLTTDGGGLVYNGYASWVYMEEILGRSTNYKAYWWAPNSEMIAFLRTDDSPVPEFHLVNANGIHGELETQRYPKPGDPNPDAKMGIVHLKNSKTTWVNIPEKNDQYIAWPFWTNDSKQIFVQWMNRGQDNIKIYSTDPNSGKIKEIYDEKQLSWVVFFEDLYLFKNGKGFLVRSDINGWQNLFYYDMKGILISKLTNVEWNVSDIQYVDEKKGIVYFHGSGENTTESHLFKVDLKTQSIEQLTDDEGTHKCSISPEGSFFIDRFNSIETPSILEVKSIDGSSILELGNQFNEAIEDYKLGRTELFTVTTEDGFELPVKWILPPDFDESKKYPVVFSIYGGPGTAGVKNSFSTFLGPQYLAQNGIIYIVADNRGSEHFGKKGQSMMHRYLGKWETEDLISIVKWLRTKEFVDETKIGITGGSYGGYVTCMALTAGADYFTHGIAEFSVTDWQLYDNVYTERYMDTPDENPDGYKNGSAITHADKYKGKMLIIHGTMDDNVHLQNTIQLVDKLQDLNKDFEMMLYPNERHGWGPPKYFHLVKEELKFWFKHLLNKEFSEN
ncbi:MAG: S9 family peptidase [Ignavibacteriales bacterium]|nr:MAG: S9 family peptidase [Ignavibacteriales bacterium]